MIVALGLFLSRWFDFSWGLPQLALAGLFVTLAFKVHPGYSSPAVMLLVCAIATLLWDYELINFAAWRLWPILYGGAGLSLVLLWGADVAGVWTLFPAGILLLVSGIGLGAPNIMVYRTYVDDLWKLWPVGLVLVGGAMIYKIKKRQSDKP
jgi:hypothetical protein